jgi:putative transposase
MVSIALPEAIETIFPQTTIQVCIVHMVRHSLNFVSWQDRKAVAADLRRIYGALSREAAEDELLRFGEKGDARYPTISRSWTTNWGRLVPFFSFPAEIRRAIYTTNAIESLNRSLRKLLKTRGSLPHDEAVFKLLYLALQKIATNWTMPILNWKAALNCFAIRYEGRIPSTFS